VLALGDGEGLLEAGFGLGCRRDGLLQEQVALESIRLRQLVATPAGFERGASLGQQAQPLLDLASVRRGLGQQDQTERPRQHRPGGRDRRQPLAELRQARLVLALQD
jgi:hypothetical protein